MSNRKHQLPSSDFSIIRKPKRDIVDVPSESGKAVATIEGI